MEIKNGKDRVVRETVQRCGKRGNKEWKGKSVEGNSKDVVNVEIKNGKARVVREIVKMW